MPAASRRGLQPSLSAHTNASSTLPPARGPGTFHRDASASTDSEPDSDEQQVPSEPAFQSIIGAEIPNRIAAALEVMRRNMEHNFETLQEAIQAHRTETDRRFEETDRRFDEQRIYTKDLFTALRMGTEQYNANRGATHIHSSIHPVGRFNEATGHISLPDGFPTRVHQFLRLKTRSRWSILINLLHFYEIQSWPTWGLYSMWPDDESDTDELLAPQHRTIEDAVEFAPEIALQELAAVIGLDYDKITINREDDERMQEKRVINRKRALSEASKATPEKMSRVRAATQLSQQPATQKPKSDSVSSGAMIGWDFRDSEERTPPEKKPRVKDIPSHGQRMPRSASDQIPTRNKTEAVRRSSTRPQTESDH